MIRAKADKLLQTLREHRGEKGVMELDFLQRLQETHGLRDEVSSDCDAESPSLLYYCFTTALLLLYYCFTAVPDEVRSDYESDDKSDAESQSRMTPHA